MFSIGPYRIGEGRTFIVAEIGSNHAGSLELAKETIEAAKESGADAVKFQSIKLNRLYYAPEPEIKKFIKRLELPEEWYAELKAYCDKRGLLFFSCPTYPEAVDLLENVGVQLYKIASPQAAVFPQLVEKVARTGKPALVSLGQVGISGAARLVNTFRQAGNERLVLLHCNSLYPTPYEKVNLRYLEVLSRAFRCPIGFSDHTEGIYVALAAVALGASVIEKHFILDRKIDTPDAPVSLTPDEFKEMVRGIRAIEKALKEKIRLEPEPEEASLASSAIYRLVLIRKKRKGEEFSSEDFCYLRHPEGIEAEMEKFIVSHFKCRKDLREGKILRWEDLEGK